jgi:hypothetical protein
MAVCFVGCCDTDEEGDCDIRPCDVVSSEHRAVVEFLRTSYHIYKSIAPVLLSARHNGISALVVLAAYIKSV